MEFFGGSASAASIDSVRSREIETARRRWRVLVFFGVFVAVAAAGLAYNYSRPAEYRASTRLEIVIPPQSEVIGPGGSFTHANFLAEVERLTSRPVLEEAVKRAGGPASISDAGDPAPVDTMLKMLAARPVEGTDVVQIVAIGPRADAVPVALNALVDAYRDDLRKRSRIDTGESVARAQEEANRLERAVSAKRKEFQDFGERHQIISLEREENSVLAQLRGQTTALNTAEEKLAAAEGQLRALKEAVAAGKPTVRAKDSAILVNLEQRASLIREELRNLERVYKQDYLVLDPEVKAKRTRLAELESQIRTQRKIGEEAALAEAEQEEAAARMTVARIREQIEGGRGRVQVFAKRIAEYKALNEQLAGLEKLHATANERALTLASREKTQAPSVKLLESAVQPREPWRPPYDRDAAISIGAGLVSALLALLILDYLNPRERAPTVVVTGAPMPGPMITLNSPPPRIGMAETRQMLAQDHETALLPGTPLSPRELSDEESGALLGAADADTRLAAALLLSGLSVEETCALRWSDADIEKRFLRVGGASARELPITDALGALLAAAIARSTADPEAPLVRLAPFGASEREALVDAALACAAHDAMVVDAHAVTAAALRHTYLAFLVRQGIRFSDLTRIAGGLPPEQLTAYMGLAPSGARLALEEVQRTLPALDRLTKPA